MPHPAAVVSDWQLSASAWRQGPNAQSPLVVAFELPHTITSKHAPITRRHSQTMHIDTYVFSQSERVAWMCVHAGGLGAIGPRRPGERRRAGECTCFARDAARRWAAAAAAAAAAAFFESMNVSRTSCIFKFRCRGAAHGASSPRTRLRPLRVRVPARRPTRMRVVDCCKASARRLHARGRVAAQIL
eukprot:COSAG02_NODE_247_length_27137_cov_61.275057_9_plen_187_part_00